MRGFAWFIEYHLASVFLLCECLLEVMFTRSFIKMSKVGGLTRYEYGTEIGTSLGKDQRLQK